MSLDAFGVLVRLSEKNLVMVVSKDGHRTTTYHTRFVFHEYDVKCECSKNFLLLVDVMLFVHDNRARRRIRENEDEELIKIDRE